MVPGPEGNPLPSDRMREIWRKVQEAGEGTEAHRWYVLYLDHLVKESCGMGWEARQEASAQWWRTALGKEFDAPKGHPPNAPPSQSGARRTRGTPHLAYAPGERPLFAEGAVWSDTLTGATSGADRHLSTLSFAAGFVSCVGAGALCASALRRLQLGKRRLSLRNVCNQGNLNL